MCISKVGQIIYGALALAAVAFIVVSLFTPNWRKMEKHLDSINTTLEVDVGLFQFTCYNQTFNINEFKASDFDYCLNWFKEQPFWDKVVSVLMIIALLASILAFVWNLLTFCACFCKGSIHKPLAGLAANTALLLLGALLIYYFSNEKKINIDLEDIKMRMENTESVQSSIFNLKKILDKQNNVSYSFYLACGALLASVTNIFVGTMIGCFADKCL